jgi:SAM-dependent methyltransferase
MASSPRGGAQDLGPAAEIWRSEADYFDRQAPSAEEAARGLDPAIRARYAHPARPWFNKEYRFALLGDLTGRRALDVGCGTGENAILLAAGGARVTGVDVSPRSIAAARRRAAATPLPVQPEFVCAPLEEAPLPERCFDLIFGDGILHHLLHDLEVVLARLVRAGAPGARFLFSEPVDRVPGMRRLRLLLPVPPDGTPNERPLVEAELELVRRIVPDLRVRAFSFVGRLNRFVLPRGTYERASRTRRLAADALCMADALLLSLPVLERLGGMVVLDGRLP